MTVMKIWCVSDGDEYEEYFASKRAAIADFRSCRAAVNEGNGDGVYYHDSLFLTEYEIGRVDKARICLIAKGEGWADKVTPLVDWTRDGDKRSGFYRLNKLFK